MIKDCGLDLYVYDEWYIDPITGTEKPMVNPKKVILGGNRNARMVKHYGAIQDLDYGGTVSVRRFAKSWRTKDPSVQWLMVQSAPLPVPHQVDAILTAQVLA